MEIAVITHAQDILFQPLPDGQVASGYMLGTVLHALGGMGHKIDVYRGLPKRRPAADLAIMHVDLTCVPDDYAAFGAGFRRCLNLAPLDISKRRVSGALLGADEAWYGPVLAKADRNYGGQPEAGAEAPFGYQVYESLAAVPEAVRADPQLVIEKFLPERDGDFYATRFWIFAGTAEHCSRVQAREPAVKGDNALSYEFCEVPEALRRRRVELGFDFGKFDFVMRDGEPVLLDANKTPGTMPVTETSTWPRTYAEALLALA